MKMDDAIAMIETGRTRSQGFMVTFYRVDGRILTSDHFPNKHAGEPLIATEEEAWDLARAFALKTVGKCVDLEVIDYDFRPVGARTSRISNRVAGAVSDGTGGLET